ncbi:hypothetical protein BLNAU_3785 [Blattamonas nauphoetae]|uniref:Uncharacterized protein n=1 Tax=Blattamonas nauphoetae TaxID=2049346 RepID=A0ABQ9YCL3_9EUKA|nr:hypothetical protein BLNAU_3785 [Blattamonas nauphoetae]
MNPRTFPPYSFSDFVQNVPLLPFFSPDTVFAHNFAGKVIRWTGQYKMISDQCCHFSIPSIHQTSSVNTYVTADHHSQHLFAQFRIDGFYSFSGRLESLDNESLIITVSLLIHPDPYSITSITHGRILEMCQPKPLANHDLQIAFWSTQSFVLTVRVKTRYGPLTYPNSSIRFIHSVDVDVLDPLHDNISNPVRVWIKPDTQQLIRQLGGTETAFVEISVHPFSVSQNRYDCILLSIIQNISNTTIFPTTPTHPAALPSTPQLDNVSISHGSLSLSNHRSHENNTARAQSEALDQLLQERDEMIAERSLLMREMTQQSNSLTVLVKEKNELANESRQLRMTLDLLQLKSDENSRKLSQVRDELSRTKSQLHTEHTVLEETQARLEKKARRVQELKTRHRQLETRQAAEHNELMQLRTLNGQLEDSERKRAALQQDLDAAANRNNELQRLLAQRAQPPPAASPTMGAEDTHTGEIYRLGKTVQSLTHDLSVSEDLNRRLTLEVSRLRARLEGQRDERNMDDLPLPHELIDIPVPNPPQNDRVPQVVHEARLNEEEDEEEEDDMDDQVDDLSDGEVHLEQNIPLDIPSDSSHDDDLSDLTDSTDEENMDIYDD